MIRPGSPEAAILALLERRGDASVVQICIACCITPAKVQSHLAMLDLMGLVSSRYDTSVPPRRVYAGTLAMHRRRSRDAGQAVGGPRASAQTAVKAASAIRHSEVSA